MAVGIVATVAVIVTVSTRARGVVLVPGASPEDVLNRAQVLLEKVAVKTIGYQGKQLDALTISVGIACWQGQTAAPDF